MNITGIPFCNAARECKKVCEASKQFVGVNSPKKHYRFCAHVFCVSLLFLAGWLITRKNLMHYGFWHYALLIVVAEICVTWFIKIHSDVAEGLQTSYLVEHYLEPEHNFMQHLHDEFRGDLEHW